MGSKIKKAPKKPIGTKWANSSLPINTKKDDSHKPFDKNKDSRPAKNDRKYNNNGGKPPYKKNNTKPYGKPGMKGGKKPFGRKPAPKGPENVLSVLLSDLSKEVISYCEKTFTEEGKRVRVKVTTNTSHEKYGFATMKIHIMDEKMDARYKDLFFNVFTDMNRRRVAVAIINDTGDGWAPIYSAYSDPTKIKEKLIGKDYLHKICDSTHAKLQKIKEKYAKKN